MKNIYRALAASTLLALPALSSAAFITGDITGGGTFSGSVTSPSAWAEENPVNGEEVNFWTLTGRAGDRVSITVNSPALNYGLSLYRGLVEPFALIVPGFNNDGDFGSNVFVAGTPAFGQAGASLLNILLASDGPYTLAVGGEGFGFDDRFDYTMSVAVTPVPTPAAWLLLLPGVLALVRHRSPNLRGASA